MINSYHISSLSKLGVVVTIIGYRSQGESVIVRIVDRNNNGKTLYCLVVDCYCLKKINKTSELLAKYGVQHVDLLCWTHPHLDHAKGLNVVLERYCDATTKYLIPQYFLNNKSNDIVVINNKDELAFIDEIFKQNKKTQASVNPISVCDGEFNLVADFDVFDYSEKIHVKIQALTPIASILSQYAHSGEKANDINQLSITLFLLVGDYGLLLGGDTVEPHLSCINPSRLENCHFVKIPHHGSATSKNLLDLLPDDIHFAGTTVYHIRGNLPDKSLIQEYKKKKNCKVFCTSDYMKKKSQVYGYVECDIDLFGNQNIIYNVNCVNGAKELK